MGSLNVSTWLGRSFNQTQREVLLWRSFVGVVNIYRRLILIKEITLNNGGGSHPSRWKALRGDMEVSGRWTSSPRLQHPLLPDSQPTGLPYRLWTLVFNVNFWWISKLPACLVDFGLHRAHNPMSQFLKISLLYILCWFCFSGEFWWYMRSWKTVHPPLILWLCSVQLLHSQAADAWTFSPTQWEDGPFFGFCLSLCGSQSRSSTGRGPLPLSPGRIY